MMGCFYEGRIISTAGLFLTEGIKHRHKGGLWGVYTHEDFRGQGIGKRTVKSVIDNLPDYIEQVYLNVWDENVSAIKIYKDLGFTESGIEKNAIKWQSQYYNEVKMVKFIQKIN